MNIDVLIALLVGIMLGANLAIVICAFMMVGDDHETMSDK